MTGWKVEGRRRIWIAMDRGTALVTLRQHEAELRSLGIEALSLFGSIARDESGPHSDVDLAAHFAPAAHMDLFRYGAVIERLRILLARPVDLVSEPTARPAMQAAIERDRIHVF